MGSGWRGASVDHGFPRLAPSAAVVASEGRSSPKLPNVFLFITRNSDGACLQVILQPC